MQEVRRRRREASQRRRIFQAAMVIILALVFAYILSDTKTRKKLTIPTAQEVHIPKEAPSAVRVELWDWNAMAVTPETTLAAYMLEHAPNSPVVIKNSPVTQWPAFRRWNASYIEQHVPKLKRVYYRAGGKKNNNVFGPIWTDDKAMSPLTHIDWRHPHEYRDLPSAQFFRDALHAPKRGLDLYYVSIIEDFSQSLTKDVAPMGQVLLTPKESQVNMWMGKAGVFTHLHIDSYMNLNVQVEGEKLFTLFPPSSWRGMYAFPFLHPSMGQGQPDLSATSAQSTTLYPRLEEALATGVQATLRRGDVLYLPPMWFHTVEALSFCINVNAWGVSEQANLVEHAMEWVRRAASLASDLTLAPKTMAKTLINRTLYLLQKQTKFLGHHKPSARMTWGSVFVAQVVESRYRPLFRTGELQQVDVQCPLPLSAREKQALLKQLGNIPSQIALVFARLPSGARDIWLANVVESIGYWASDEKQVGSFLSDCF